jgi:acetate---CoA ligase (ADP-forming)
MTSRHDLPAVPPNASAVAAPGGHEQPRVAGLRSMLTPERVALVGASARNLELVANVQRGAFAAHGVHPHRSELAGLPCVASIAQLPAVPDLAVLAVGPARVTSSMRDALALGVRSFVVPGLGVEAGQDGPQAVRELRQLAAEAGAAVLGPNCMGIASPTAPSAWLGTIRPTFVPGPVAVVSQSGSVADAFLALGPRLGFAGVVSCGAELNRDAADWIAYFADDPATTVIGVFLETVRRPDAFRQALRLAAEAGKPVVCLKVGRSELARRAALAHTGAVVGSHAAFGAVLRAHGALQVDDLPEMIELLGVMAAPRRPRGSAIGAVTESGAEAALLGDLAERHGLHFPPLPEHTRASLHEAMPLLPLNNPLDPWAVAEPVAAFTTAVSALADSGVYDMLLAQVDMSRYRGPTEQRWCTAVVHALADAGARTGVFTAVSTVHTADAPDELANFATANGVSLLKGVRAALDAISRASRWQPLTDMPEEAPAAVSAGELAALLDDRPAGSLAEYDSAMPLERAGVRFARRYRAASANDAAEYAEQLGYPVVVKTDGPAHKAREGGVVLGLTTAGAVRGAAARLGGRVLVAEQVPPGLEAYCGMVRDTTWGPTYAIGRGGTAVENYVPITLVGPLTRRTVASAIHAAGLDAWTQPLTTALLAVQAVALSTPRVDEIDVNPIICAPDGTAHAVDALVVLGP